MKEKFITFIRQNMVVLLIFFIAAFLRFSYLSPWLEDWDSVQFALGLHNFSLVEHQPHAPGYLLYIALGKLFYIVFRDDTTALTTLSATLGSLSVFPLFFLAKSLFNKNTAILSSIIFVITPIGWMMSEVALTNIPGLFFLLAFASLLFYSLNKTRHLIIVGALGGLILGVRFTEFPVIVSLLALSLLWQRQLKTALFTLLSFTSGILTWLIPLIFITGPKSFLETYVWIAGYILRHDTQLGGSFALATYLKTRLNNLWGLLQIGYTPYYIIFAVAGLAILILTGKGWGKREVQFISLWLFSYLIPLSLVYNLEVPRYTLPLLPPLAIATSCLFVFLLKKSKVTLFLLLVFLGVIFSQSWSQVIRFKQEIPPTIQPVQYVKQNFNPEKTVIIATVTYRQFQYYAPEYKIYYGDKIDKVAVLPGTTIILDYLESRDKIEEQINNKQSFSMNKVLKNLEFNGSRDIFTRVPSTTIFVLIED